LVNRAAGGDGWFFKMHLADAAAFTGLLDEASYQAFLETL
jgi:glycine cleavage system H lipoate-binding protein